MNSSVYVCKVNEPVLVKLLSLASVAPCSELTGSKYYIKVITKGIGTKKGYISSSSEMIQISDSNSHLLKNKFLNNSILRSAVPLKLRK